MMAGVRFSTLNSFYTSVNHASHMRFSRPYSSSMNFRKLTDLILPSQSCLSANHRYHRSFSSILGTIEDIHFRILPLQSVKDNQNYRNEPISGFPPKCLHNNGLSNLHSKTTTFPVGMSSFRAYSSFFGSKGDGPRESEVKVNHTDVVGSEWVDNLKNAWQSVVDAAAYTGEKAKELSSELTPHVQQLVDSHPYVRNVVIPVCWTLTGTMLAWLVMPRVLRKLHKYSMQGTAALLPGNLLQEHVPYDKSFWGALEDPVRYLITFMAFSQLGVMIAPTTIASQYLGQAWRGAVIVSFVWFLHRWKTNVFVRSLTAQNVVGLDRERLLALDKLSSVGLFVLGLMALAEACGVAVQSILTVGGIGGVATAFAARDILGNVLSGLSMQFSKPFSLGDTIKAGSIEGQVIEMGLTTTSLLNAEKFPVIVPNSLFSSQVIVNKSRAQWRAMATKIPLWIDNLEKIPEITEDIKTMLKSNPKIFLGKEAPYCFLSRIEKSFAELSVGCNLKYMSKEEFYSTEQDILLQVARIIKQHGAALGSTSQDLTYQPAKLIEIMKKRFTSLGGIIFVGYSVTSMCVYDDAVVCLVV